MTKNGLWREFLITKKGYEIEEGQTSREGLTDGVILWHNNKKSRIQQKSFKYTCKETCVLYVTVIFVV